MRLQLFAGPAGFEPRSRQVGRDGPTFFGTYRRFVYLLAAAAYHLGSALVEADFYWSTIGCVQSTRKLRWLIHQISSRYMSLSVNRLSGAKKSNVITRAAFGSASELRLFLTSIFRHSFSYLFIVLQTVLFVYVRLFRDFRFSKSKIYKVVQVEWHFNVEIVANIQI
jgi:hypothetical protein